MRRRLLAVLAGLALGASLKAGPACAQGYYGGQLKAHNHTTAAGDGGVLSNAQINNGLKVSSGALTLDGIGASLSLPSGSVTPAMLSQPVGVTGTSATGNVTGVTTAVTTPVCVSGSTVTVTGTGSKNLIIASASGASSGSATAYKIELLEDGAPIGLGLTCPLQASTGFNTSCTIAALTSTLANNSSHSYCLAIFLVSGAGNFTNGDGFFIGVK